jgi:hypothetical protein
MRFIEKERIYLDTGDYNWLFRADDLMTLHPNPQPTILGSVVEDILVMLPMRIFPSFAVWTSFPLLFPACFGLISFFSS